jgi:hypothetical protein
MTRYRQFYFIQAIILTTLICSQYYLAIHIADFRIIIFITVSNRQWAGYIHGEDDLLANKNEVGPKVWRVYERRSKKGLTKGVRVLRWKFVRIMFST